MTGLRKKKERKLKKNNTGFGQVEKKVEKN